MPHYIRKVRGENCWSVRNKYTKKVFAKCATKENAKKQLRLLRAIEFNKSFKLRNRKDSMRMTRSKR
jgi:hypothetical protein